MTGEKASLALELTPEQFEATRFVDHPAAELMYLSWEYVKRAGPESGVRVSRIVYDSLYPYTQETHLPLLQDKKQTLTIYPQAKSYREWVKDSPLVRDLVQKLKAESKQSKA